ncbi:unnamed protein product [Penicillium nalgiovense]|nr:unnamed protein product [Penicillium nalgiovense]
MSRMWEVDPETRTKLLQISKTNGNDKCCDCGAPSPQWASPKFGTFICLNCAGTHRGLGVHISFVRSITMDAFKHAEIQRMELGGNDPWKSFYDEHPVTVSEGRTFEDSTIKERYESESGEEWKERLSCKVDGREYVQGQEKKNNPSRSSTPLSLGGAAGAGASAISGGRSGSPAASSIRSGDSQRGGVSSKKEQNEAYFAKLGNDNATRADNLPPSQGGKFTGFGVVCLRPLRVSAALRPLGDLEVGVAAAAAVVVSRLKIFRKTQWALSAKDLGGSRRRLLAESDFAAQARVHASTLGQNLQTGVRGAADQFNKFVEGEDGRGDGRRNRVEPERRDFWDDFSSVGDQETSNHRRSASQRSQRSDVVGTAAMRKGPTASSLANSTPGLSGADKGESKNTTASTTGKGKDEWDDNW